VLLAIIGVAVWVLGGQRQTHTVSGSITLYADDLDEAGDDGRTVCGGTGGYQDMQGGILLGDTAVGAAPVVVKDGAGTVLATSVLQLGTKTGPGTCVFKFEVKGVPETEFYQVEVSHRGAMTYSKRDLESSGWTTSLSLGSPS
jgi:hypothetical protein